MSFSHVEVSTELISAHALKKKIRFRASQSQTLNAMVEICHDLFRKVDSTGFIVE